MNDLGFHRYAVGAIQYDAQDIAERQKTKNVRELAESRKEDAINPITIAEGGRLIAGRDRLAADMLNGASTVWAHVYSECTEADLLRLELKENAHRRHDNRDALIARLVKLTEADLPHQPLGNSGKRGRPQTAKGAARAEVAKAAKTTPEAVRRAEFRAAEKEAPAPKAPPPIKDFGIGIDPELAAEAAWVQAHLSTAAKALARAQAAFTEATEALEQLYGKNEGRPMHYAAVRPMLSDAARLREQTHVLAGKVRAEVPVSLCPYGKGTCTKDCPACRGLMWATADQEGANVPAELLREGADAMVSNGEGAFVKIATAEARGDGGGALPLSVTASEAKGGDSRRDPGTGGAPVVAPDRAVAPAAGGPAQTSARAASPAKSPRPPRRIRVEMDDGTIVDPTNPDDVARYSGEDAPHVDLPDAEDMWTDDDGEAA